MSRMKIETVAYGRTKDVEKDSKEVNSHVKELFSFIF
jgi:hypothetical protein